MIVCKPAADNLCQKVRTVSKVKMFSSLELCGDQQWNLLSLSYGGVLQQAQKAAVARRTDCDVTRVKIVPGLVLGIFNSEKF